MISRLLIACGIGIILGAAVSSNLNLQAQSAGGNGLVQEVGRLLKRIEELEKQDAAGIADRKNLRKDLDRCLQFIANNFDESGNKIFVKKRLVPSFGLQEPNREHKLAGLEALDGEVRIYDHDGKDFLSLRNYGQHSEIYSHGEHDNKTGNVYIKNFEKR